MNTFCKAVIFLFVLVSAANIATAKEPVTNQKEICKLLKKEKGPVVYLLDEHGKVSKGPIDFGRYNYTYREDREDNFYIPTRYNVIVYPARIQPEPCSSGGCLKVKKVASICPNSNNYLISYTLQEYRSNPSGRSVLPYKVDHYANIRFEDPTLDIGEPDIKFRFDLRVVGEIYDATKK